MADTIVAGIQFALIQMAHGLVTVKKVLKKNGLSMGQRPSFKICCCVTGVIGHILKQKKDKMKHSYECIDIDECLEKTHNCHGSAYCDNNEGSFYCECVVGFRGDGIDCENENECEEAGGARYEFCHDKATCIDLFGSFRCECITGYFGDGWNCTDIDECDIMEGNSVIMLTSETDDRHGVKDGYRYNL